MKQKHNAGAKPREGRGEIADAFVIVGKNPVREALRAGRQIDKLYVMKDNRDHVLGDLIRQAKKRGVIVHSVDKAKLAALADGDNHQGIAAVTAPFAYQTLEAVLARAETAGEDAFVVVMDHLIDPHNFGAIVRSANLCGAHGVIFPDRRSASVTAVSMKASAGAMNATPMVKVGNLARCLETLKAKGFWVAAADMAGAPYYTRDFTGKLALVIGSEGKGISPNVKKHCDFTASIPNYGSIDSFNASVAAGILMAEAARQRHGAEL